MVDLKKVIIDNLYETIHSFVGENKIIIDDYESMVKTILRMIKAGYCFTIDRDILRDAMESLTYMYSPDDDMNKDRLMQQFMDDDSDDDDEDDDDDDFNNLDMLKMMQMMSGQPPNNEEVVVKKEELCTTCPVTGESCENSCKDSSECVEESNEDAPVEDAPVEPVSENVD